MTLEKYGTKEKIHNARLLTDEEYDGFITTGADDMVNTEDVVVPTSFARSHTSEIKIGNAISFYRKHGYFDKPITVIPETNERGLHNKLVIVDGFSRYIAAIRLHIDIIPAKYIDLSEN